jgi:rod shape-determining protein MreB and related proteins
VISCVAGAPPELAQDLIERGIHLVGGGSLLKGFDVRINSETDVPVRMVRQPLESVVLGAGRVIESYEELRDMFMGSRR